MTINIDQVVKRSNQVVTLASVQAITEDNIYALEDHITLFFADQKTTLEMSYADFDQLVEEIRRQRREENNEALQLDHEAPNNTRPCEEEE